MLHTWKIKRALFSEFHFCRLPYSSLGHQEVQGKLRNEYSVLQTLKGEDGKKESVGMDRSEPTAVFT